MKKKFKYYINNDILLIEILVEKFDFLELSDTSDLLRKIIQSYEYPNIIFNFSRLKYIDSSIFGFLIETRSQVEKNGNKIVIISADDEIRNIMKLLSVDRLFYNASTLNDAMRHFKR